MFLSQSLDKLITEKLISAREAEKANRKPSGKLSASKLWWPRLWWWLEKNGYEQPTPDEFSLRKFLRGKQIEDWLVSQMKGVVKTQEFVEYRDAIGYIDAVVDTEDYDLNVGEIPHEIKSISNAKYRRVLTKKEPDKSHLAQASFYAMATKKTHFGIIYVSTDDLRLNHWIFETKDYQTLVDSLIDEYGETIKLTERPPFEPREDWQKKETYSPFGKEGLN